MIKEISDFLSSEDISTIWKYLVVFIPPILGFFTKFIIDHLGTKRRLLMKYNFEQKAAINDQYSLYITPLLKDAEELNYRLWNLRENIHKKWNRVEEKEWNNPERYYLRSFAFRLLSFLYNLQNAEYSIYHFDAGLSSRKQKEYFKFIKTLKYFFCQRALLDSMKYGDKDENHFYKDYIIVYTKYIVKENGELCDLKEFEDKMKISYDEIKKVIEYILKLKEMKIIITIP